MYIQIGATPTITITTDDVYYETVKAFVIIDQGVVRIIKDSQTEDSGVTVIPLYDEQGYQNGMQIDVSLTQEETLRFEPGVVYLQVIWITEDGKTHPSDIAWMTFGDSLMKGVLKYEQ